MENTERVGLTYTIIAIFAYSFVPIFSRGILVTDFPALDLAIWRFGLATPIIWLMILWRQRTNPLVTDQRLPRLKLIGLGFVMTAVVIASFWGLERVPASTYIVIFYSYPAMVAGISALMGIRLTIKGWIALILTVIGIVVTTPEIFTHWGEGDTVGYILIMVAAFLVAVYFILNSRLTRGYHDLQSASAWTITGAFIPLAVMALFTDVQVPATPVIWNNLIGLAVLGTAVAIYTLLAGINKLGAAKAAIITAVEVPGSIFLAVLLLGESLTGNQVVGSILIMSSMVLLNVKMPRLQRVARGAQRS